MARQDRHQGEPGNEAVPAEGESDRPTRFFLPTARILPILGKTRGRAVAQSKRRVYMYPYAVLALLVTAMAVFVRVVLFPLFEPGKSAVGYATILLILISVSVIGVGSLLFRTFLKHPPVVTPESDRSFRFLFDNWPSPVFLVRSEDGGIIEANARAVDEYQYERDELCLMSFLDLGLEPLRATTLDALEAAGPSQMMQLPMLQHERKDGSVFTVSYLAQTSIHRGMRVIVLALSDPVSSLEKRMRLIQTSKMVTLGEIATGIAHELNQPLNALKLGCDYLAKNARTGRELTPDQISALHEELSSNIDRATRTINYVRRFGRKPEETMFPMDINTSIRNIFSLVGTQLKARGVQWNLELAEGLPPVVGDIDRLEQVFINLVINARDAMTEPTRVDTKPSDSPINVLAMEPFLHTESYLVRRFSMNGASPKAVTIKSFQENDTVVVTVNDTGPGIPESLRSKIFEPFFTTKEPGKGTGLGLAIASSIVQEHHGTIEVVPGEGGGASFRLTFPTVKPTA